MGDVRLALRFAGYDELARHFIFRVQGGNLQYEACGERVSTRM
jgi:hypothetical protein